MSESTSPRIVVVLDAASATAQVLAEVSALSGLGSSELKARLSSGEPVLDVEMFTNDWYGGGADRLLDLLSDWEFRGIAYSICEIPPGAPTGGTDRENSGIGLDVPRNTINAARAYRGRIEALDDFGFGGTA